MKPVPGTRAQARAQARAAGARALAGRGVGWRLAHSLWILPTFALGFTGWVSFLYIGVRAQRRSWLLWAAGYLVLTVAMLVAVLRSEPGTEEQLTTSEGVAALLIVVAWFVPMVHAIALIPERLRVRALDDVTSGFAASGAPLAPPPTGPYAPAPQPADTGTGTGAGYAAPGAWSGYAPPGAPGGFGAPSGSGGYAPPGEPGGSPADAPPGASGGYATPGSGGSGPGGHGGLGPEEFFAGGGQSAAPVDLNTAPAEELARLPGMSPELAQRAVGERARRHGFAGAEDFGLALGLPPHLIARLRETAIAGPRQAGPAPGHQDPPGNGPRIVDL